MQRMMWTSQLSLEKDKMSVADISIKCIKHKLGEINCIFIEHKVKH